MVFVFISMSSVKSVCKGKIAPGKKKRHITQAVAKNSSKSTSDLGTKSKTCRSRTNMVMSAGHEFNLGDHKLRCRVEKTCRLGVELHESPVATASTSDMAPQTSQITHGMQPNKTHQSRLGKWKTKDQYGHVNCHRKEMGDQTLTKMKHFNRTGSKIEQKSKTASKKSSGSSKRKKYKREKKKQSERFWWKKDETTHSSIDKTGTQGTWSSGSSRSGGESNLSVPEIPGFYYDEEKKKYFKILSSTNNVNVVTKETIAKGKAEKKRLEDLSKIISSKQSADTNVSVICRRPSNNIVNFVFRYSHGDLDKTQFENFLLRNSVRCLKPAGVLPVFRHALRGSYEDVEHMLKMDLSYNHDKLLGVWSVKGLIIQRMQLLHLNEKRRTDLKSPLSLDINASGTTVLQSWNKITSMCWSPFPQHPGKKYILYTTMCHTGHAFSLAYIRNLDPTCQDEVHFFDFNLGTHATWTSAWNLHSQQFSVGTEKGCVMIDVVTRRLWEFNTLNSDTLAQVFSPQNGQYLYSGTRKGQILCHDLRSLSTRPVACMSHKTSIACLRMSQNDTSLFASDFSGKLNLWDLRMKRILVEYPDLHNEYSRLPFHLDETESIIYGAGQDCYTRLWCVKTGKLLLSIPPPCPASIDNIPSVQYSTRWANRNGNAGLVMGLGEKLFLYSGQVNL